MADLEAAPWPERPGAEGTKSGKLEAEPWPRRPGAEGAKSGKLEAERVQKDFPILERQINGKRLVYLDSASSSQKPRRVLDAMNDYYELHHANVHRGVYTLAQEATAAYEGARQKVARFINSPTSDEVVFTKNVTEALNLVANTWGRMFLDPGDAIVLSEMEHHSNLVPWLMLAKEKELDLRYIPVDGNGLLDLANLDQLLDGAKLLSVTGVSNVLGTVNPVRDIAAAARSHGVVSVFDFAQWTPHLRTDVQDVGADFVAFTGHKMLGPTGIGVLWGRAELLDQMPPFLGGGEMIRDVQLDGFTTNDIPWKFEAGTPPIAEAVGLGAAVDYLESLTMEAIGAHEHRLTAYAIEILKAKLGDQLQILGPPDAGHRAGVLSFELANVHPHDVSQMLDEKGICIRAGHHCAKPLHRKYGVGSSARASFYVYNDEADIDVLADALLSTVEFFK